MSQRPLEHRFLSLNFPGARSPAGVDRSQCALQPETGATTFLQPCQRWDAHDIPLSTSTARDITNDFIERTKLWMAHNLGNTLPRNSGQLHETPSPEVRRTDVLTTTLSGLVA